ncbi:pancreatic triacylglycerol lipase-like [Contarinia nasturtii]|uniref:pancreatic triacylglycerol lipase-like n=1 Tax=Contarinia nasturtii TaxID=265458 RepID=UPI0012D3D746|nr:pancreatic triacylglycerol lipase-like [Contarinia nasturtii]
MSIQNIYRFITVTLVLLYANGICAQNSNYSELLETIGIFYYSPFYHEEQLVRRSVKLDGFIDDVPIKVLIHGYIASRYHSSIEPIKKAYLSAGNVNLMIVDWSQASYQMYDVSRRLTSQVALRIAQILDAYLQANNIDSGLVQIIGHSLGAHIAGNVGRSMKSRVGRITGLDPAAPLYLKWSYDAIRITDAPFVDIIHTNGERLGESWARGHADFYPNFGIVSQPGCEQKDVSTLCTYFLIKILIFNF